MSRDLLFVSITNPDVVLWEGEASSVSSINSQGPFDILPGHANFITVVDGKPININRSSGEHTYTFRSAVIYVRSNSVTIYADL